MPETPQEVLALAEERSVQIVDLRFCEIEPPDPIDKDLYELEPGEATTVNQVPGSLEAVLDALEADHDVLLEGGVFTHREPLRPLPARARHLDPNRS